MNRNIKIFFIVITFAAFLHQDANAQYRKGFISAKSDMETIKKYFRDNITVLDPIEGAYSVEEVNKGWNNYITFPDRVNNYYEVIVKNGDKFVCLGLPSMSFVRIGDTNVYNCKFKINGPNGELWFSQRVILQNGALFTISKTLPVPGNIVGAKYNLTMTFIKDYPTASVYEEAIKSEIQKKQEQQERATDWSGSGFALNNGYICTNYHVIDGAKNIEIHGVQGDFTTSYSAKVVASDKFNDLAILKVDDVEFKGFGTVPYNVKTSMADVGEEVFVLGYPLTTTMGDEIKLTTGVVSSRTGYQGDVSLYQISAPIQPGNSGGPLFDSQGNLIGVVSAKHAGAENVGYAIKASYLRNLTGSSITEDVLPANNLVSSLPLTGKVKKVKDFVYFIECSSIGDFEYQERDNQPTVTSKSTNRWSSSSISIKRGETIKLTVDTSESVWWESDDPDIATITKDGFVTGISFGKACVWAHIGDDVKLYYVVVQSNQRKSSSSSSGRNTTTSTGGTESSKLNMDFSFDSTGLSAISLDKSSRVFDNPEIRKAYTRNVVINRVVITNQNTIIEMTCCQAGGWCHIEKGAALYANGTQYKLTKAENIPYSPDKFTFSQTKQKLSFRLYFPVIDITDVSELNFVESNSSTWRFYGISLKQ